MFIIHAKSPKHTTFAIAQPMETAISTENKIKLNNFLSHWCFYIYIVLLYFELLLRTNVDNLETF